MINTVHPKVLSQPPFKKREPDIGADTNWNTKMDEDTRVGEDPTKCIEETRDDIVHTSRILEYLPECGVTRTQARCLDTSMEQDVEKLPIGSDFNQNVIGMNSRCFEELCTMMNDLEYTVPESTIPCAKQGNEAYINDNCPDHQLYDLETPDMSNQIEPERDYPRKQSSSSGSTYEDIMSLLGVLEQEGCGHNVSDNRPEMYFRNTGETQSNKCIHCHANGGNELKHSYLIDTMREDLATVQLQLEERDATVKCLKNELKVQLMAACEKLKTQTKERAAELQAQKTKYQGVIKRHQKFIEQIISEKKDLTEKCNVLTERIKEIESKHEKDLKVIAERHAVELQRVRELSAASEKIRRERWLEAKTSKIKEMTVKGLEPELRNMVEQHQQELQEVRSVHIKELQDTELRTIRRCNQQLEELRLELTSSYERTLNNEKEMLQKRYYEKLDQQEGLFQEERRKLSDDLERTKKIMTQHQTRLNIERDTAIKQAVAEYNEKICTLTHQHKNEIRALQESLKVEQETWIENCRRQNDIKLEKMESRIRHECSRERDRQIELAIERLEKETLEIKTSLQQSAENRLRCMKDKYEAELKDLTVSEELCRIKLAATQDRLAETTTQLQGIEDKLRQCTIQLTGANQTVDQLKLEKNNAKRIARQEIEAEKRELEENIDSLRREIQKSHSDRDVQMTQLYSRVKLIITQKDLTIGKLVKETDDAKKRCDHLEKLLDQQRKDYVLKSM